MALTAIFYVMLLYGDSKLGESGGHVDGASIVLGIQNRRE
jgi:hypothetical protein